MKEWLQEISFSGRVIFVVFALSAALLTTLWPRLGVLSSGKLVVLRTSALNPEHLTTGKNIQLTYQIGELDTYELKFDDRLKKHQNIFVSLEKESNGFWRPVALHEENPRVERPGQVVIQGSVREYDCEDQWYADDCRLFVNYGIEKYAMPPVSIKTLERFGLERPRQLVALEQELSEISRKLNLPGDLPDEEARALRSKSRELSKRRKQLLKEFSKLVGDRFAVLVRVSKKGRGVIAGLRVNDKPLYEEPLF